MAIDRGLIRPALVVGIAVVVLAAVIWALGGFAPAQPVGRPTAAGRQVDLQRWSVVVGSCEYADHSVGDGYAIDPVARVRISLVNRTDATLSSPTDGVLGLRLGAGPADPRAAAEELAEPHWASGQQRGGSGFDPDVPADGAWDAELPAQADASRPLTVLISDERNPPSFTFRDNWQLGSPVAAVTMTCRDTRTGRP